MCLRLHYLDHLDMPAPKPCKVAKFRAGHADVADLIHKDAQRSMWAFSSDEKVVRFYQVLLE